MIKFAGYEKIFNIDFGLCSQPGFLKTAGYIAYMTGPGGKCFNYSDNGPSAAIARSMECLTLRVMIYA